MQDVRWGILGCGNVTEVKSGPGFYKSEGSRLVAVMRRDASKAADYARRHDVERWYGEAATLIADPNVDAVYIATPPSTHHFLALQVARAGKPCMVEKPMAMDHSQCLEMCAAFEQAEQPLFVAYYRRALPRFLKVRELLQAGAIGQVTSAHIVEYRPLASREETRDWRFDASLSGGGLFMDLGSHGLDLLDFLLGPIQRVGGFSVNSGHTYAAEDVTVAALRFQSGVLGTGVWNFNGDHREDRLVLTGSDGAIRCPVFSDTDVVLKNPEGEQIFEFRNPPHVHQPLIQAATHQILGGGVCESTGESGARTSWVMDQCLADYRNSTSV